MAGDHMGVGLGGGPGHPPAGSFRELVSWIYGRLFFAGLPRLRGYLAIRFFDALYRDFTLGTATRSWGAIQVAMEPGSSISIGDRFSLTSSVRRSGVAVYSPCALRTMPGARLVIGDDVSLNGTSITCRRRIEIGTGTMIAANVVIVDSDFHRHWPPTQRRELPSVDDDGEVTIGTNVWIGMGTLVLKGARIGDNSIIGAGSVVVDHIPSNVMAAGVPARVMRQLGPQEAGDGAGSP